MLVGQVSDEMNEWCKSLLLFIVGLYNTGNSCFINAALQILLNCPNLIGFFGDQCQPFIGVHERDSGPRQQPSISEQFMGLMEIINGPDR